MKFECPHCGEKSISGFKKALLGGNMMSKGLTCPSCGKKSVNGNFSSVVRSVLYGLAFIYMAFVFMTHRYDNAVDAYSRVAIVWVCAFVIRFLLDMFTGKLERTLRTDAYDKGIKKNGK